MRLLVRSWNIFHGRTLPEGGAPDPERAVRLVSSGAPDVVCLQEVPVWALPRLEVWSAMTAIGAVAMPALGGPAARRLTALAPRLRSGLTGQANAVLVGASLRVESHEALPLNPCSFRREDRDLGLSACLAWALDRRVAQLVRVATEDSTTLVVNVHLTAHRDSRPAERELLRAVERAEAIARPGEPILVCGDLNLTPASSSALRGLVERGFSAPLPGIDHILARGLSFQRGPEAWPDERRRLGGRLLSDHAPLEAAMIGT